MSTKLGRQHRMAVFVIATLAVIGLGIGIIAQDLIGTHTPTDSASIWQVVVNDQFTTDGVLPSHWRSYNGAYGSGPKNCAHPQHTTISGGYLHMKAFYEPDAIAMTPDGKCGAGWYTAGIVLVGYSSVSQRITTRFRIISTGGIVVHHIVPMRWPDVGGTTGGEEDMCESSSITFCSTFLHWADHVTRDYKKYFFDLTAWHTFKTVRDGYHVTTFLDGVLKWDFTGDEQSLPSTLKHVILQQECDTNGCPLGTTGSEEIQVDWIKVENPAPPIVTTTTVADTILPPTTIPGPTCTCLATTTVSSVAIP